MSVFGTSANVTDTTGPSPLALTHSSLKHPKKKKKPFSIAPFYTIHFVEIRGRARRDGVKEMFVNIMCTAGGARRGGGCMLNRPRPPSEPIKRAVRKRENVSGLGGAQTPGTKTHSAAHFQPAFISAVSPLPRLPQAGSWLCMWIHLNQSTASACLPLLLSFPVFLPPSPLQSKQIKAPVILQQMCRY